MSSYVGINGTARKMVNMYVGVDGVARKIVKAYVGVDGIARLFWTSNRFPLPDFLIDFKGYTTKEDEKETYIITDWKGTLNGESSTKIVVPDNENIIL